MQNYLNNILGVGPKWQNYNPTLGFSPIGAVKGLSYPYKPFYRWTGPASVHRLESAGSQRLAEQALRG